MPAQSHVDAQTASRSLAHTSRERRVRRIAPLRAGCDPKACSGTPGHHAHRGKKPSRRRCAVGLCGSQNSRPCAAAHSHRCHAAARTADAHRPPRSAPPGQACEVPFARAGRGGRARLRATTRVGLAPPKAWATKRGSTRRPSGPGPPGFEPAGPSSHQHTRAQIKPDLLWRHGARVGHMSAQAARSKLPAEVNENDTCGIRTHAGRPHRLSRPTP